MLLVSVSFHGPAPLVGVAVVVEGGVVAVVLVAVAVVDDSEAWSSESLVVGVAVVVVCGGGVEVLVAVGVVDDSEAWSWESQTLTWL